MLFEKKKKYVLFKFSFIVLKTSYVIERKQVKTLTTHNNLRKIV